MPSNESPSQRTTEPTRGDGETGPRVARPVAELRDLDGTVTLAYSKRHFNKGAGRCDRRRVLVIDLADGRVATWHTRSPQAFQCHPGDRVRIHTAQIKGLELVDSQLRTLIWHVNLSRVQTATRR